MATVYGYKAQRYAGGVRSWCASTNIDDCLLATEDFIPVDNEQALAEILTERFVPPDPRLVRVFEREIFIGFRLQRLVTTDFLCVEKGLVPADGYGRKHLGFDELVEMINQYGPLRVHSPPTPITSHPDYGRSIVVARRAEGTSGGFTELALNPNVAKARRTRRRKAAQEAWQKRRRTEQWETENRARRDLRSTLDSAASGLGAELTHYFRSRGISADISVHGDLRDQVKAHELLYGAGAYRRDLLFQRLLKRWGKATANARGSLDDDIGAFMAAEYVNYRRNRKALSACNKPRKPLAAVAE